MRHAQSGLDTYFLRSRPSPRLSLGRYAITSRTMYEQQIWCAMSYTRAGSLSVRLSVCLSVTTTLYAILTTVYMATFA